MLRPNEWPVNAPSGGAAARTVPKWNCALWFNCYSTIPLSLTFVDAYAPRVYSWVAVDSLSDSKQFEPFASAGKARRPCTAQRSVLGWAPRFCACSYSVLWYICRGAPRHSSHNLPLSNTSMPMFPELRRQLPAFPYSPRPAKLVLLPRYPVLRFPIGWKAAAWPLTRWAVSSSS